MFRSSGAKGHVVYIYEKQVVLTKLQRVTPWMRYTVHFTQ